MILDRSTVNYSIVERIDEIDEELKMLTVQCNLSLCDDGLRNIMVHITNMLIKYNNYITL